VEAEQTERLREMTDAAVYLSILVAHFVILFVGLGSIIVREDMRIKKAQKEARKYLRQLEEGRNIR
jgi:hypothetical protein